MFLFAISLVVVSVLALGAVLIEQNVRDATRRHISHRIVRKDRKP